MSSDRKSVVELVHNQANLALPRVAVEVSSFGRLVYRESFRYDTPLIYCVS